MASMAHKTSATSGCSSVARENIRSIMHLPVEAMHTVHLSSVVGTASTDSVNRQTTTRTRREQTLSYRHNSIRRTTACPQTATPPLEHGNGMTSQIRHTHPTTRTIASTRRGTRAAHRRLSQIVVQIFARLRAWIRRYRLHCHRLPRHLVD